MANNHNQFQFTGHLVRDTTDTSKDNKNSAFIDIAVNSTWIQKQGEETKKNEEADFFRISLFGSHAVNAVKYLGKGSFIFVQGSISSGYIDKEGKKIHKITFKAEKIEYVSTNPPSNHQNQRA